MIAPRGIGGRSAIGFVLAVEKPDEPKRGGICQRKADQAQFVKAFTKEAAHIFRSASGGFDAALAVVGQLDREFLERVKEKRCVIPAVLEIKNAGGHRV